ncbi:hypothetical protein ED733_001730 [Metarhizium rileyi]|uniref:Aminoglycoside phosphotransferase domain-containing protein n=1 Tax=Metarhizium rileyi (strain RCEF 4871) TaxID=1649241 RepID=A0A5C6G618_METRR|nr:hypothetical protein ED733_001730 [Metarhizium rileyi]
MRYVAAKTTIPVPRVHAYSFTEGSPIHSAFIVMDYIHGQTLKDLGFMKGEKWFKFIHPSEALTKLHEQLAGLYIQLRQLEFPEIGALGLPVVDGKPSYSCDPDEIRVCHRPLSIEMMMQEFEGMDPGAEIPPRTTFSTARSYVEALFRLADNELDKSQDTELDLRGGMSELYARHYFRRFVLGTWLDSTANQGPFVLMHGDMVFTMCNLLFDDEINLVGVIDWEWSFTVPAQMLVPPVWLSGGSPEWMLIGKTLFYMEVEDLLSCIRNRELALQISPQLSKEWERSVTWCHTAVVAALLGPELIHDVYWHLVFYKTSQEIFHESEYRDFYKRAVYPRLMTFMKSPERKALLARKQEQQKRFFEEEKEYFGGEHL